MRRNLAEGRTAMLTIKDPIDCGNLFTTLGKLFDDVRHQRLAVGVPYHQDYTEQEDEILRHLNKMAKDKQHDKIPLPASVPDAREVLHHGSSFYHRVKDAQGGIGQGSMGGTAPPASEMEETDDERMQVTESTDTEMYQALEQDLVVNVTHDRDTRQVKSVAFMQAKAAEQAISEVQAEFYETTDTRQVLLKRHSEEREEDPKRRPSPQTRVRHEERGRSILKKKTANTPTDTSRQPHPGTHTPGPFGVGSPLARLHGHEATNAQAQSTCTFQTKLKDCYDSYTESHS